VADLQHALDLPLGNEGYSIVCNKALVCQKWSLK